VNEASTPALLPPLFRWKEPAGAALNVMYHSGYGAVTVVRGSDLAVAIVVRNDNAGPHTPEEIAQTFAALRARFPNSEILGTNLTRVANEVEKHADALPVVTQEIGDTWIHGIASDPLKVARYRELCRLRQTWIRDAKFQVGDATDVQLLRHLLLEVEHTWGTDTKTWLDFDHYTPKDLLPMLATKNYKVVEFSWTEKRQDLFSGVDTLPAALKQEATVALASLVPRKPEQQDAVISPKLTFETADFQLKLDEKTGAIHQLRNKNTGRDWASPDHPLALFSYQTLSQKDYANFFKAYVISEKDWAKKDFGKPNIERFGAESKLWLPTLLRCEMLEDSAAHRILAGMEIQDPEALASGRAAFPRKIFVEYVLLKAKRLIEISVSWFEKAPTRMPEALWFSFWPQVVDLKGWSMQKSGQQISPYDVVESGNRHMHAISDRICYQEANGSISFVTLDAPLVALGDPSPLNFSRREPALDSGIHFNLFNNAWGTNYIMWFAEDMRFRFAIEV
jgi:hypothetical protein